MGIEERLSIAQLAARFRCSKATVRYWLRKYELSTRTVASSSFWRAAGTRAVPGVVAKLLPSVGGG